MSKPCVTEFIIQHINNNLQSCNESEISQTLFYVIEAFCVYTYATNQQKHNKKIRFIIIYYYSPTCFGHFCNHNQGVTQEYQQYTAIDL